LGITWIYSKFLLYLLIPFGEPRKVCSAESESWQEVVNVSHCCHFCRNKSRHWSSFVWRPVSEMLK
jgi:hypothetical protein